MSFETLNKNHESRKGYWTDNESRGLYLSVTFTENATRISLSSEYWYRTQHFDLKNCGSDEAWRIIKSLMKECGRTLLSHETNEEEGMSGDTEDTIEQKYYRVPYLSAKQVDQIYYLLKHSLTTENRDFAIAHSIFFDTSKGIAAPVKRKRRKKKNTSRRQEEVVWQEVKK